MDAVAGRRAEDFGGKVQFDRFRFRPSLPVVIAGLDVIDPAERNHFGVGRVIGEFPGILCRGPETAELENSAGRAIAYNRPGMDVRSRPNRDLLDRRPCAASVGTASHDGGRVMTKISAPFAIGAERQHPPVLKGEQSWNTKFALGRRLFKENLRLNGLVADSRVRK